MKVDAHSELLGAYPWGFDGVMPNASDNLPDTAAFDGNALVFREQGKLPHPNAETHDWAALVAANRDPSSGVTGDTNRGDQGDNVCMPNGNPPPLPSQCDDGPFGRGKGGQLRYELNVPAGGTQTLWVAVAGSDEGLAAAQDELDAALADPGGALERKIARRERLARRTHVTLPGDTAAGQGVDWAKQNLADSTQYAEDLEIRWVDQGKRYPPPAGDAGARPLDRRRLPRLPVAVRHGRRVHRLPDGRARPVPRDQGPHARAARRVRHRQRRLGQGRARVRLRRLHVVRPERRSAATRTRRRSSRAPWR